MKWRNEWTVSLVGGARSINQSSRSICYNHSWRGGWKEEEETEEGRSTSLVLGRERVGVDIRC